MKEQINLPGVHIDPKQKRNRSMKNWHGQYKICRLCGKVGRRNSSREWEYSAKLGADSETIICIKHNMSFKADVKSGKVFSCRDRREITCNQDCFAYVD